MQELIPHDRDVESALLGAFLADNDTLIDLADRVVEADFYDEKHRTIFNAILEVARETSQVDIITVTNLLRTTGNLERAGGAATVSELAVLPDVTSAEHHAQILRDKRVKREILAAAKMAVNRCSYDMGSASDVLHDLQRTIFGASEQLQTKGAVHVSVAGDRVVAHAAAITSGEPGALGLSTGIGILDRTFGYLTPKNVYIVAGGVSAGKSTMVDQITDHVADQGGKVMLFALEMSVEERAQRFMSRRRRIPMGAFKSPHQLRDLMPDVRRAAEELRKPPIYIDDDRGIKPLDIYARAKKFQQRHGLDLIVVDYLQLVRPPRRGQREQEVAEISGEINAIAGTLDVPVLLVCQLSRTHQHEGRPPEMRDLRESGRLEQDAHGVFMIYRPDLTESEARLYVRKNRNGPVDEGRMMFEGQFNNFKELTQEQVYDYEDYYA
jgi:replicative DNA helicase